MQRLRCEQLGAADGPPAIFAQETWCLNALRCHTEEARTFYYSENNPIARAKLPEHVRPGTWALVVFVASSSSYLWLHREHGPVSLELCAALRDLGCRLQFVVRPATDAARERWRVGPGSSLDFSGIFAGFWREGGPDVLVWDPSQDAVDVGQNFEHVDLRERQGPAPHDVRNADVSNADGWHSAAAGIGVFALRALPWLLMLWEVTRWKASCQQLLASNSKLSLDAAGLQQQVAELQRDRALLKLNFTQLQGQIHQFEMAMVRLWDALAVTELIHRTLSPGLVGVVYRTLPRFDFSVTDGWCRFDWGVSTGCEWFPSC